MAVVKYQDLPLAGKDRSRPYAGGSRKAGVVDGARGGAKFPAKDIPALKRHLAKYYEKMDRQPPWEGKAKAG